MSTCTAHILLIDDDPLTQCMVEDVVQHMGHRFSGALDGHSARTMLDHNNYDLVILDRRLPDTDGLLLAPAIVAQNRAALIILSSLTTANDQILGLGMGAADYIGKPVEPAVLRARIEKHLALSHGLPEAAILQISGAVSLNRQTRRLSVAGRTEVLSPAENRLLICLIQYLNQPVNRSQMSKAICGHDWVYGDRTTDVLISRLRRRLRDSAAEIITVHGVGYMLSHATAVAL